MPAAEGIASTFSIGKSYEGRDMVVVRVTGGKHVTTADGRPAPNGKPAAGSKLRQASLLHGFTATWLHGCTAKRLNGYIDTLLVERGANINHGHSPISHGHSLFKHGYFPTIHGHQIRALIKHGRSRSAALQLV